MTAYMPVIRLLSVALMLVIPSLLSGCDLTGGSGPWPAGSGAGRVIEAPVGAIADAYDDDSALDQRADDDTIDSLPPPGLPADGRPDACYEMRCPAPLVCVQGACVHPDDVDGRSQPVDRADDALVQTVPA